MRFATLSKGHKPGAAVIDAQVPERFGCPARELAYQLRYAPAALRQRCTRGGLRRRGWLGLSDDALQGRGARSGRSLWEGCHDWLGFGLSLGRQPIGLQRFVGWSGLRGRRHVGVRRFGSWSHLGAGGSAGRGARLGASPLYGGSLRALQECQRVGETDERERRFHRRVLRVIAELHALAVLQFLEQRGCGGSVQNIGAARCGCTIAATGRQGVGFLTLDLYGDRGIATRTWPGYQQGNLGGVCGRRPGYAQQMFVRAPRFARRQSGGRGAVAAAKAADRDPSTRAVADLCRTGIPGAGHTQQGERCNDEQAVCDGHLARQE